MVDAQQSPNGGCRCLCPVSGSRRLVRASELGGGPSSGLISGSDFLFDFHMRGMTASGNQNSPPEKSIYVAVINLFGDTNISNIFQNQFSWFL